ncbi:MAG TPA: hypothetical protein VGS19_06830 [Streptosporangiaceae bacterium]|nr:hypothetical protein [Streptosporangiaceae bacterium]
MAGPQPRPPPWNSSSATPPTAWPGCADLERFVFLLGGSDGQSQGPGIVA